MSKAEQKELLVAQQEVEEHREDKLFREQRREAFFETYSWKNEMDRAFLEAVLEITPDSTEAEIDAAIDWWIRELPCPG